MDDYQSTLHRKQTEKLRTLCGALPPFVFEFMRGIENRTSLQTRIAYARDLRLFLLFLQQQILIFQHLSLDSFTLAHIAKVNATHIELFLEYLSYYQDENGKEKTNSECGKSRKLASIRSFYKYFVKKGKLQNNVAAVVDMPKLHDKPIIKLEADEVANLLDNVESGAGLSQKAEKEHAATALRDTALITLFLSTGIRISELVGLNISDFDFPNNAFQVTRKGGNQAILYFGEEAKAALLAYLFEREKITVADQDTDALFLSIQRKRIGVRGVQKLVKKYAKVTTPLKKISPHKLRSTFGTMLYRETGDIYLVADVLGHKDVNTTKKHYAAQDQLRKFYASKQIRLREDEEKK